MITFNFETFNVCYTLKTMMGWSPQCYIPSFVEIGPSVLEKIFEGLLPYEPRCEKTVLGGSDLVRYKPCCTASEDG